MKGCPQPGGGEGAVPHSTKKKTFSRSEAHLSKRRKIFEKQLRGLSRRGGKEKICLIHRKKEKQSEGAGKTTQEGRCA